MSTPIGFERWEPGHPWGDVVYDDGSKVPVEDRDGSIEAETRAFGARQSAMPQIAPPTGSTPSLTGAADPLSTAPPPTGPGAPSGLELPPPPPLAPPMPATAPLSATEKASVTAATTPTAEELAGLGGAPGAAPGAAQATPAAQVLAEHGITPPAPASQGQPPAARTPAEESIRALAPNLLPSGAQVQAQGPDAQSAQNILDTAGDSLLLKGKGITQDTNAKGLGVQADASDAVSAYYAAAQRHFEGLGQEAAATVARDEASNRLSQAQQRPIQQHADVSDWGVIITMLGAISGGIAEATSGGRLKNTTLDMINTLNKEWVQVQTANKGALVTDLERVLGDKNAALALAQSKIKTSIADEADSRKRFARTPSAMKELESIATAQRAQALDDYNKSQALVMGHVATSVNLSPPKPTGPAKYTNPTLANLGSLGITEQEWDKGLDQVTSKEGPTILQTAEATKQIDADISELESIMSENGGSLPTKGALNIPKALVPALSRLGWKPGMDAEKTNGIINTYLTQKAKGYGGTITNGDRESAGLEFGASGEGFMRGMQRLRESNNRGLASALEKKFPGRGQQTLEILLSRTSRSTSPGIAQPTTVPLEKNNVVEAGPAPTKPMEANASLNVTPEEQARVDAANAKKAEEETAARKEREAEVARRKPVERMKL